VSGRVLSTQYFTDVGHSVLVVADSQEDYDLLTKWAKSVKGKSKEAKSLRAPQSGF
jgi:hypothetical protein